MQLPAPRLSPSTLIPSRTASFKTVERQLREGEQQRTSKLSAIGLTPANAFRLTYSAATIF